MTYYVFSGTLNPTHFYFHFLYNGYNGRNMVVLLVSEQSKWTG